MAINIGDGLNISASVPVDARIVKSKEEMLNMTTPQLNRMPDKYFCICSDDGQLYLFDKNADPSTETGKFKMVTSDCATKEEVNNKSKVTASQSGSSTDTINYITIDDEEYKLPISGSTASYTAGNGINISDSSVISTNVDSDYITTDNSKLTLSQDIKDKLNSLDPEDFINLNQLNYVNLPETEVNFGIQGFSDVPILGDTLFVAKYDGECNNISETYATKTELETTYETKISAEGRVKPLTVTSSTITIPGIKINGTDYKVGHDYTAGSGLNISNDVIMINDSVMTQIGKLEDECKAIPEMRESISDINRDLNQKVNECLDSEIIYGRKRITGNVSGEWVPIPTDGYTAGSGITISNKVISTDNSVIASSIIDPSGAIKCSQTSGKLVIGSNQSELSTENGILGFSNVFRSSFSNKEEKNQLTINNSTYTLKITSDQSDTGTEGYITFITEE